MQVGTDATCMHTNFGGRGLSSFGDTATLKNSQISLLAMDNQLKKFMQLGLDVTCMYTNIGGRDLSSFGDTATLKNGQISLSTHGL